MTLPLRWLFSAIDFFLPTDLRDTGDSPEVATRLFRTRVVIGFSGVLSVLVLIMFLSRLILEGTTSGTLWVLLVTSVVLGALPPVVRIAGTHVPGAVTMFVIAVLVIPIRSLSTGGIYSTVTAWFTIVPVVAFLALGTRAGLIFSAVCVIEAYIVTHPEVVGLTAAEHDAAPMVRFVVLAVLLVLTAFLAFLYDAERRGQVRRMNLVTSRLEAANQDLVVTTAQAQAAARAKAEFLASMSHELRTPLNGVMGMTRLLGDSELTVDQRSWIRTLDGSASLLLTVIDDILDVSRLEAGAVELNPVPLCPAALLTGVGDLLRPRAQAKGLALTVELAGDLPAALVGDDMRLKQVVINLVGNAIKFTDAGSITLRASASPSGDSAWLRFEVADTGIGIEKEAQERIFAQFSQADASTSRRFGGTGLGLSISQKLVQLMGGRIGVDSTVGDGSTFWVEVELPITEQVPDHERVPVPVASVPASVLVVDDNAVNRVVAEQLLLRLGHRVQVVDSGEAALSEMAAQRFDVVLMDCEMPGLDGYETTRRRRTEERDGGVPVPIVALTAHALPEAVQRCIDAGMDAHLAKPIVLEDLARIVGRFVESEAA